MLLLITNLSKFIFRIEPRDRLNVFKLLKHPFITGDDVFSYCLNNINEIQVNELFPDFEERVRKETEYNLKERKE